MSHHDDYSVEDDPGDGLDTAFGCRNGLLAGVGLWAVIILVCLVIAYALVGVW